MPHRDPLEQLVDEALLERSRRALRAQVRGRLVTDSLIAEAIAAATVALVGKLKTEPVDNLGGYFFKTARNELLRLLRTARRHVPLAPEAGGRRDRRSPDDVDSQVEAGIVFKFLMGLLDGWAAQREADVVRLLLEAAYEGIELDTAEVLEHFEELTGEPISVSQFYDLKSRGLRRLRGDLERLAAGDGVTPRDLIDP